VPVSPQRDRMRVLDEQKLIWNVAAFSLIDERSVADRMPRHSAIRPRSPRNNYAWADSPWERKDRCWVLGLGVGGQRTAHNATH